MRVRRTPALTDTCRAMFIEAIESEGWVPGMTTRRIAEATGLELSQVRDALFSQSADAWRSAYIESRRDKNALR